MTLHTGRLMTLLYVAFMLIFVSCEDTRQSQVLPDGMGLVDCTLNSEIEVKSAVTVSEEKSNYNVQFLGVNGYADSEVMRFGNVSWPMPWYFGIYKLYAESCTREQAETLRGRLRHEGTSASFSVVNEVTARASVTCYVANVLVKVNFDDTMYERFDDYKLTVTTVSAPVEDEEQTEEGDEEIEEFVPELYRTLDFTPIELTGYYNLQSEPIVLNYILYVKEQGAEEFLEAAVGSFSAESSEEASVLNPGDIITFNVKYTGTVEVTDGIKFIVTGVRQTVNDGLHLDDYVSGSLTEDE